MNRRSRISKGQSKYGCFTCKARKVKCDETKPACLRCQRAHRVCEGYPERALESPTDTRSPALSSFAIAPRRDREKDRERGRDKAKPSSSTESTIPSSPAHSPGSPTVPADLGFSGEERQHIKLALRIVFRPQVDDFQYAYEPLKDCLFRFDYLCPSTKVAAAAVGAVAEQLIHPAQTRTRSKSAKAHLLYIRAIRLLRQDLALQNSSVSSLLLSSILLMSVELMLSRRQNAMKHLCGAAQVLSATTHIPGSTESLEGDKLELANRAIDILRLSYSDCTMRNSVSPVPHSMPRDISEISQNMELFDKHVLEVVHAGFCFITTSALAICRDEELEDLQIEQKQHLVDISQCLTEIENLLERRSTSSHAHIFRLRCMCLSMFIELSTLFAESEAAWDDFAHQFEQIVEAAEAVLEARSSVQSRLPPNLPVFSLQIGIVQPLYLVAMKYRHRTWRRRAIMLLQDAGQDGPWKGPVLATVALWCTQVEEADEKVSRPPDMTYEYQAANLSALSTSPQAVPEENRIAVCRFIEETAMASNENANVMTGAVAGSLGVKLLRRRRPIGAIPARVLSPIGVDHVIEAEQLTLTRLDEGDWEEWMETISLRSEHGV